MWWAERSACSHSCRGCPDACEVAGVCPIALSDPEEVAGSGAHGVQHCGAVHRLQAPSLPASLTYAVCQPPFAGGEGPCRKAPGGDVRPAHLGRPIHRPPGKAAPVPPFCTASATGWRVPQRPPVLERVQQDWGSVLLDLSSHRLCERHTFCISVLWLP